MTRATTALIALGIGAVVLGAVTLWALEGKEVIVVRTRDARGAVRETRTWVADQDGALWVEAAVPERPFLQQLLATPHVEVVRHGVAARYRATAVANPAGHERIRRLLSAKYGWADCWIGMLTDTSRSVAVKLEPV